MGIILKNAHNIGWIEFVYSVIIYAEYYDFAMISDEILLLYLFIANFADYYSGG